MAILAFSILATNFFLSWLSFSFSLSLKLRKKICVWTSSAPLLKLNIASRNVYLGKETIFIPTTFKSKELDASSANARIVNRKDLRWPTILLSDHGMLARRLPRLVGGRVVPEFSFVRVVLAHLIQVLREAQRLASVHPPHAHLRTNRGISLQSVPGRLSCFLWRYADQIKNFLELFGDCENVFQFCFKVPERSEPRSHRLPPLTSPVGKLSSTCPM